MLAGGNQSTDAKLKKDSEDYIKKYAQTGQLKDVVGGDTDVSAAVAGLTGKDSNTLEAVAQMVMLLGLAFGGLFAANALSIVGASNAMGAMKAGGKALGGWAGRRVGGRFARELTREPKPGEKPTRLQRAVSPLRKLATSGLA